MGHGKRKQPAAAQQQKLAALPLIKKPLSLVGTQIKVPGSFWEGMMTAEERSTLYSCIVREFSALHTFAGGMRPPQGRPGQMYAEDRGTGPAGGRGGRGAGGTCGRRTGRGGVT